MKKSKIKLLLLEKKPIKVISWVSSYSVLCFTFLLLLLALLSAESTISKPNVSKQVKPQKIKETPKDSVENPKNTLNIDAPSWKSLKEDGLHDPSNPAIHELQHPGEALSLLPNDYKSIGNQVDWVRALNNGLIKPRTRLEETTPMPSWDVDIIMPDTAGLPMVRFPHKAHTDWLDCSNCHPHPFKAEFNANSINMFAILSGRYCGQCHGAVAFPLTECRRCHSVSRKGFTGKYGPQPSPAHIYPPVKQQKTL